MQVEKLSSSFKCHYRKNIMKTKIDMKSGFSELQSYAQANMTCIHMAYMVFI